VLVLTSVSVKASFDNLTPARYARRAHLTTVVSACPARSVFAEGEPPVSTAPASFPPIDFTRIGPSLGERFPDVILPDQHGQTVDLHAARAGRRALVLFYRSARW